MNELHADLGKTIVLQKDQIKEIAEELECGMRYFYNKKTGETKTVINFNNWNGAEEEPWEDDLQELNENWIDYFKFVNMDASSIKNTAHIVIGQSSTKCRGFVQ